jgi:hypothetical protein
MNLIPLTGLAGNHPLGALAAFGLLRCCAEMDGWRGARLGWRPDPQWCAVLETGEAMSPEALVTALVARQQRRAEAGELNWAQTLKATHKEYLAAASEAEQGLREGRRVYADFLTAFACELQVDDNGQVAPSAFYMTSGQQKFLKEARALASRLAKGIKLGRRRKSPEEMFREALFGPWKYEDHPQHSLGLDPSTKCLHALRARSPSADPNPGVTAAVWLALEALPLFPCFLSGGGAVTTGFSARGRNGKGRTISLTWPVWECPVLLDTVRSLLSLPELAEAQPPARELRARGIGEVFRSERYKVKTKGAYFILRPAYPCL